MKIVWTSIQQTNVDLLMIDKDGINQSHLACRQTIDDGNQRGAKNKCLFDLFAGGRFEDFAVEGHRVEGLVLQQLIVVVRRFLYGQEFVRDIELRQRIVDEHGAGE